MTTPFDLTIDEQELSKGIAQLIEALPRPEISDLEDLKKLYFEDNASKHGTCHMR